jgi:hypothetical protein
VLLPAWPCQWDVQFKLWAPLNTSVELVYSSGVVRSLRVEVSCGGSGHVPVHGVWHDSCAAAGAPVQRQMGQLRALAAPKYLRLGDAPSWECIMRSPLIAHSVMRAVGSSAAVG